MADVLLICGTHRNERSAAYLAPKISTGLKRLGHVVTLLENPEKRTLMDFVEAAYKAGERLSNRKVQYLILDGWTIKAIRQNPGKVLFDLHNYGVNPTIFEPVEESDAFLISIRDCYPCLSQLEGMKGMMGADQIYFHCGNCVTIEIPEVQKAGLPAESVERARKVIDVERYGSYLLDTDMDETERAGWLEDQVVETLVKGMDIIMRSGKDIDEILMASRR